MNTNFDDTYATNVENYLHKELGLRKIELEKLSKLHAKATSTMSRQKELLKDHSQSYQINLFKYMTAATEVAKADADLEMINKQIQDSTRKQTFHALQQSSTTTITRTQFIRVIDRIKNAKKFNQTTEEYISTTINNLVDINTKLMKTIQRHKKKNMKQFHLTLNKIKLEMKNHHDNIDNSNSKNDDNNDDDNNDDDVLHPKLKPNTAEHANSEIREYYEKTITQMKRQYMIDQEKQAQSTITTGQMNDGNNSVATSAASAYLIQTKQIQEFDRILEKYNTIQINTMTPLIHGGFVTNLPSHGNKQKKTVPKKKQPYSNNMGNSPLRDNNSVDHMSPYSKDEETDKLSHIHIDTSYDEETSSRKQNQHLSGKKQIIPSNTGNDGSYLYSFLAPGHPDNIIELSQQLIESEETLNRVEAEEECLKWLVYIQGHVFKTAYDDIKDIMEYQSKDSHHNDEQDYDMEDSMVYEDSDNINHEHNKTNMMMMMMMNQQLRKTGHKKHYKIQLSTTKSMEDVINQAFSTEIKDHYNMEEVITLKQDTSTNIQSYLNSFRPKELDKQ